MNRILTPFKGIDNNYLLYQSISETISRIEKDGETYVKEIWLNEDCDNQVPWTILRTSSGMNFFFANDKLFKIYVSTGFQGSLSNGIKIGMKMKDAMKLDSSLKYDDWEEDWQSSNGYWIEDDPADNTVLTITIFIKEWWLQIIHRWSRCYSEAVLYRTDSPCKWIEIRAVSFLLSGEHTQSPG